MANLEVDLYGNTSWNQFESDLANIVNNDVVLQGRLYILGIVDVRLLSDPSTAMPAPNSADKLANAAGATGSGSGSTLAVVLSATAGTVLAAIVIRRAFKRRVSVARYDTLSVGIEDATVPLSVAEGNP